MSTATSERVPANTADEVNQILYEGTLRRIMFYEMHPEQIPQRLRELDQEWDIERMIETEAPTMTLTGILLGLTAGRHWLVLPLFAQGMMLVHAIQGYYPMIPLFRRMGFRTQREIATERYALLAIQGAFKPLAEGGNGMPRADRAYQAVRPARSA